MQVKARKGWQTCNLWILVAGYLGVRERTVLLTSSLLMRVDGYYRYWSLHYARGQDSNTTHSVLNPAWITSTLFSRKFYPRPETVNVTLQIKEFAGRMERLYLTSCT
jgi:hypothetical protein